MRVLIMGRNENEMRWKVYRLAEGEMCTRNTK